MWKQACFHNAIKNFKPLSHDLAVYDRTPEGEPNRSYEFLMKAARDYLERKRLEKMRQATKKSVSGKRDAAPAPNRPPSAGKPQGICYDFQAGKCTRGKDCRYKHEKSDKGKGGGKKGKSRSKSRGTSRSLSPGSRNQVCKFWKAGKCHRGSECAFQHPPKPAAPSTKDEAWEEPVQEEEEGRPIQVVKSRFQFLEGLSEPQGQRGKTIFLWLSCSLPDARSDDGRSRSPFDQHSSRAGRHCLHTASQPAFCHASYTQSHCFIWV